MTAIPAAEEAEAEALYTILPAAEVMEAAEEDSNNCNNEHHDRRKSCENFIKFYRNPLDLIIY